MCKQGILVKSTKERTGNEQALLKLIIADREWIGAVWCQVASCGCDCSYSYEKRDNPMQKHWATNEQRMKTKSSRQKWGEERQRQMHTSPWVARWAPRVGPVRSCGTRAAPRRTRRDMWCTQPASEQTRHPHQQVRREHSDQIRSDHNVLSDHSAVSIELHCNIDSLTCIALAKVQFSSFSIIFYVYQW